jgi:hypothetical protein
MAFLRRQGRASLPQPGAIRRERRALLDAREERIRDLGGLIYEMFRYDRFNEALVRERCLELLDLDRRLDELDELYRAATAQAPLRRCTCGAELPPFSRYCPSCGTAAPASP